MKTVIIVLMAVIILYQYIRAIFSGASIMDNEADDIVSHHFDNFN